MSELCENLSNATIAFENGQYEVALELCNAAIKENAGNVGAYAAAGNVCLAMDKHEEALRYYREASQLDPQNGVRYFDIGNVYFAQELYAYVLENYVLADMHGCSDEIRQHIHFIMGMFKQAEIEKLSDIESKKKAAEAALYHYDFANNIAGLNVEQKEILLRRAQIYTEIGEFDKAEMAARQLKLLGVKSQIEVARFI